MLGIKKHVIWTAAAGLALTVITGPASASVMTVGCAEADSCTLAELYAGGSLSINDTSFSNWMEDLADPLVNPANINVVGIDETSIGDGKATLGFSLIFDPALALASDQALEYDWDLTASSSRMFVELAVELMDFSLGGDFAFIEASANIPDLLVTVDDDDPMASGAIDSLTSFVLDGDIQSETEGSESFAMLGRIDFLFTVMGGIDIPAPAGLPFLLGGVMWLVYRSRQKRISN